MISRVEKPGKEGRTLTSVIRIYSDCRDLLVNQTKSNFRFPLQIFLNTIIDIATMINDVNKIMSKQCIFKKFLGY